MKRCMLGVLLLLAACSDLSGPYAGAVSRTTIPDSREWIDVPFANLSSAQKLDIYLPPSGNGPFPVVLWIHAGGWARGSHHLPSTAFQRRLTTDGYALVSVGYRFSGEAVFPAQIHDVKTAVRFLRAHRATYALRTGRIGAWGSSAGGHLAALLGTSAGVGKLEGTGLGYKGRSSRVQAVVDWFGPTDLLALEQHLIDQGCSDRLALARVRELLGALPQDRPAWATMANPITHVTADDPPFRIYHGARDCVVPARQSELLFDALTGAAVPAVIQHGAYAHTRGPLHTDSIYAQVKTFFDATIK